MSGISGIVQWLTEHLGGLTNNLIVGGLAVFALVLGFFSIYYLHRRRQMLHQERMAALIKGLHYAGVAKDVFTKPAPDSRTHLLKGLRWVFGALGLSAALYGYEALQPTAAQGDALSGALAGVLPGAIGLAHLVFSRVCSRQQRTSGGPVYRVAGRRY